MAVLDGRWFSLSAAPPGAKQIACTGCGGSGLKADQDRVSEGLRRNAAHDPLRTDDD